MASQSAPHSRDDSTVIDLTDSPTRPDHTQPSGSEAAIRADEAFARQLQRSFDREVATQPTARTQPSIQGSCHRSAGAEARPSNKSQASVSRGATPGSGTTGGHKRKSVLEMLREKQQRKRGE